MSTAIIQSLTFTIFRVSMKIATLHTLLHMDTLPADWSNTNHYIDSHLKKNHTFTFFFVFFSTLTQFRQQDGMKIIYKSDAHLRQTTFCS